MMKTYQAAAILWDMDGTIVDTAGYHFLAWQNIFRNRNIPFSQETQKATFGLNSTEIIAYHLGYQPPQAELKAMIEEKEELFRKLAHNNAAAYCGVQDWMSYFQAQGMTQVIASSAPMRSICELMENLGFSDFFSGYFSGENLPAKPDPRLFLSTAKSIQVEPGHCLVIEDTINGIGAARNAGMNCFQFTDDGNNPALAQADLVFKRYTDIPVPPVRVRKP